MALNQLMWDALRPGETSVSEANKGAVLQPVSGETVLVFGLDDDDARKLLNATNEKMCDYLFFYSNGDIKSLILVELKSVGLGHFEEQILNAKNKICRHSSALKCWESCMWAALILPRVTPQGRREISAAAARLKANGIELRYGISSNRRDKVDLRELFANSLPAVRSR